MSAYSYQALMPRLGMFQNYIIDNVSKSLSSYVKLGVAQINVREPALYDRDLPQRRRGSSVDFAIVLLRPGIPHPRDTV
eukprot:SAG31_NODE_283_length_18512_cov_19.352414_20_plen_79_part_00